MDAWNPLAILFGGRLGLFSGENELLVSGSVCSVDDSDDLMQSLSLYIFGIAFTQLARDNPATEADVFTWCVDNVHWVHCLYYKNRGFFESSRFTLLIWNGCFWEIMFHFPSLEWNVWTLPLFWSVWTQLDWLPLKSSDARRILETFPTPWRRCCWTASFWNHGYSWAKNLQRIFKYWMILNDSQTSWIRISSLWICAKDSVSDVVREIGKDSLLFSSLFIGFGNSAGVFNAGQPMPTKTHIIPVLLLKQWNFWVHHPHLPEFPLSHFTFPKKQTDVWQKYRNKWCRELCYFQ